MAGAPSLISRYRRTGADPPFGDPRRAHGVGMEGYYWRLTDARAGRVVAVLCGVCRAPDGVWALVALAAHPEGVVRHAVVAVAEVDQERLGVRAGSTLSATEDALRVDLGPGARLHARFTDRFDWPRRALGGLGLGQLVPGLGQYWHPHLLGASVAGAAQLGDFQVPLGDATAYAEKNWGSRFAGRWWWGQAQGFADPQACVCFAGGRLDLGPVQAAPTAVVVRLGNQVLRLAPPLARTVAAVGRDAWRVSASQGRLTVRLEAEGDIVAPALLPVPLPRERRVELRSRQLLAGRLRLVVRRGARTLFAGESALAGLERESF